MKVGVVVSNFYPKISKMLLNGSISKLKKNKISNFKIITVPGTFEIPVVVSNLIKEYDDYYKINTYQIDDFVFYYHLLQQFLTNH